MKSCIYILVLLISILITSCEYDYQPDIKYSQYQGIVIINSYLSPKNDVKIELYRILPVKNRFEYTGLKGAFLTLYEDNDIIYEGDCDSILILDHKPKEGMTYRVKVDYDSVAYAASTTVPHKVTSDVTRENGMYIITSLFSEIPSPVWITASLVFTKDSVIQFQELYSKSSLLDEINKETVSYVISPDLGNIYYNGFIRVNKVNIHNVDTIVFRPLLNRSLILKDVQCIRISVLSGSIDYDQYNRSSYQFFSGNLGNEFSAFFYQPKTIYSNIVNGHGIFAGYTERYYDFTITQ